VQDDGIIDMRNINIMAFPDEVIWINKQTGQIVPLHNIVCGPIEPTRPQLGSWAVADNGALDAFNMYETNDIWVQHELDPRVNTCRRMIWLRKVGIFLDYKTAYSKDSECTDLLGWFTPADAMHTRYTLDPIKIYATKREVNEYNYRLDTMGFTESGESQEMMTMIKDVYINNLEIISTEIDRMHIDPEFWYQQHTLDSGAQHLNQHRIEIVQKYIRGDATRMETYIELSVLVYKHRSCKGIFMQRLLTPNAIQSMHADSFCLSDDTRTDSSPNASKLVRIRRSRYWRRRSQFRIPSNHCRPSRRS
jgi:hypothetical protein